MGSLFSGPKIPAPPPPPPPSTIRDEVNGVEQVPVTQPDGSVTYVTRQIPLTAAQQAEKDALDTIMSEALADITKLSATDYQDDEHTAKVLDQWQSVQKELLGKGFATRKVGEEEELARRGLGDSSAGLAVRRARALDEQDSQQNLQLGREALSDQVRAERLGLQQNLYNLASGQVEADNARVYQAAVRGQSAVSALNAQRNASLLDYYDRQAASSSGTSVFGNAFAGSLGRTAGSGPFGAVGSLLGSFFGK